MPAGWHGAPPCRNAPCPCPRPGPIWNPDSCTRDTPWWADSARDRSPRTAAGENRARHSTGNRQGSRHRGHRCSTTCPDITNDRHGSLPSTAPHHHGGAGAGRRPSQVRGQLTALNLPASALAVVVGVLSSGVGADGATVVGVVAQLAHVLD